MKLTKIRTLFILTFLCSIMYSQDIPSDFLVGEYEIVDQESLFGDAPAFNLQTINITAQGNQRSFDVVLYPTILSSEQTVNLIISNSFIQLEYNLPGVGCAGSVVLDEAPLEDATTYNSLWTDEYFKIYYTEDSSGNCSGGPNLSSFTITKAGVDCFSPLDINFNPLSESSLELELMVPPQTIVDHTLEYGVEGYVPGTGTEIAFSSNTAVLNYLQLDETYDFYVVTNCSSTLTSQQIGPFKYSNFIVNDLFFIDSNGVTCKCPDADFGQQATLLVNGEEQTFVKRTEQELRNLIEINANSNEVVYTCTSGITNMSSLFEFKNNFFRDISHWDVSNVADMNSMFYGASVFNQPLAFWDTSSVTTMRSMFNNAFEFNQPLENWNVSNVLDMSRMFSFAQAFNQPLAFWDTSNLTNMSLMFSGAFEFNQPLENWDVSSVLDMSGVFTSVRLFDQPLNNWDVSSVTTMRNMFYNSTVFNQDLNEWDTSNVTDISGMFTFARNFNGDISSWDTSSVVNMQEAFYLATSFNGQVSNWDVGNVTNMNMMFHNASLFDQDLSNWNFNPDVQLSDFISYTRLSILNYELLLNRFFDLELEDKKINADLLGYCDATAREYLINERGWQIFGDIFAQCGATLNPSTTPFVTKWALFDGFFLDQNDYLTLNIKTSHLFDYQYEEGEASFQLISLSNIPVSEAFGITLEPAGGSESPNLDQLYVLGTV